MAKDRRIVLVLLVLLGLAGCGKDPAAGGAGVVVIGDSVTEQSADAIVGAIGLGTVVDGRSGFRTDELLPVAEDALAGEGPPVAVVMAGYNDVWQGRDREAPVAELVEAVAAGADCAIWVLVPTKGQWERARAQAVEQRVVEAAEEAGVAVETGWRDAVDALEGPDPDPALVVGDGVHPNEAGQQKVAEVMAAAVDREC